MTELGRAYGGALFLLAQDEGIEKELLEQLNGVCHILKDNPMYMRLIRDKSITKAERLSLLDQAFSGQVHSYMLNFMKLLCERDEFGGIFDCLEDYHHRYNEKYGIVPAKVVAAEPLQEAQLVRLKEALERKTGKHVELSVQIDSTVVGGLRVEMAGKCYDNTLESRMDHLRRALTAKF